VANRISTLISAFGVLVGAMFLLIGIGEYQAGASVLWAVGGVLIFLIAVYALVRDLRTVRKPVAGRDGEGRTR
jgi:ABC-type nickel/cobalt efflux system permease component RcnA